MTFVLVGFLALLGVLVTLVAGCVFHSLGERYRPRRVDHTYDAADDMAFWWVGACLLVLALLIHGGALWWVAR